MQPGIRCCLRKAQNIWLFFFFFQSAKNCFVLNKGKKKIYKVKNPKSPQPESRCRRYLIAATPLPHVSAGGQGQDTKTVLRRAGQERRYPLSWAWLTHPDSRRNKPRKRKHVVYRLVSSSLPLQFPDSPKPGHPHPGQGQR